MTKILIDTFHGGLAQDTRDFTTTEAVSSGGFVVSKTALTPARETIKESGQNGGTDPSGLFLSGFIVDETTGYILANGYSTTSSAVSTLWAKDSSTDITKGFQKEAVSTATYIPNTLVMYKGKPFAVGKDGSNAPQLIEWTSYIATSIRGTGTAGIPTYIPQPVVHPEDNILYFAYANKVYSWDGSTFRTVQTVPESREITSLKALEGYLIIGTRSLTSYGTSIAYIWGRDYSLATFQGSVNFGQGDLLILTVIDNSLYGVSYVGYNPLSSNFTRRLVVRGYDGGDAIKLKEIEIADTQDLKNLRVEKDGKCYFTSSQNSDSLWVLGKNINGKLFIDRDRFIFNGEEVQTIYSFGMVGDYLFADIRDGVMTTDEVWYTKNTDTYSGTAYREFLLNHGMTHEDRNKKKQLKGAKVMWEAQTGDVVASTVSLELSVDGGSYEEILTDSAISGLHLTHTSRKTDSTQFDAGREIQLQVKSQGGAKVISVEYEYDNLEQK